MNVSRLSILLPLLLICQLALSQTSYNDGYVVLASMDTIKGSIQQRHGKTLLQSVSFRFNNEEHKYLPNEIQGYGFENGPAFSSLVKPGVFVQVLVLGELSLFSGQSDFYLKKDGAIINLSSKNEEKSQEVNGRWKSSLYELVKDCDQMTLERIRRIKLNTNQLTETVLRYNNCKTSLSMVFPSFQQNDRRVKLGLSLISISSNFSTISGTASGPYPGDNKTSDLTLGINIEFPFKRISQNLSLEGSIFYTKASESEFSEEVFNRFSPTRLVIRTKIDREYGYANITVPINLKYTVPMRSFSLFFGAGPVFNYFSNFKLVANNETVTSGVTGSTTENFSEDHSLDSPIQFGLGIKAGVAIPTKFADLGLFFDVHLPQGVNTSETAQRDIQRHSFGLSVYF